MDKIISFLTQSIDDEILSKEERRSLKKLVASQPLNSNQLNFLRGKIFELANEKATTENYRFIIEWVKATNSALLNQPKETSDVYFSPGDACRNIIIKQLSAAIKSVNICVFTISDDWITKAIMDTHARGVDIKIITDNEKSEDMGSDIEQLHKHGVRIKMDNTPNHMHHKFMVVDNVSLITGSYNWTRSAAKFNHENILLTKEGGVVKSYLNEFSQLWKSMDEY